MKKALISGITGQDGSYLTELLLDKGYEVHGIIRRSSSFNTFRIDHLYRDKNIKLVIAGDADHKTAYSEKLKKLSIENNVILTGFIKGEKLNELFTYARLFVLPSYHEGLPIALLEAMSCNINVLVSNIPANMEVDLEIDDYFEVGKIEKLTEAINMKILKNKKTSYNDLIKNKYNWDNIALQTKNIYDSMYLN